MTKTNTKTGPKLCRISCPVLLGLVAAFVLLVADVAYAANASCSAPRPASVNGVCGTSHGGSFGYSTPPASNLCNPGSASAITTNPTTYTWTCSGSGGGSTANCSANRASAAVNGACGSATSTATVNPPTTNLCSDGTASGVTSNPGTFNWTCNGSGGGSTANCSSPRVSSCSNVQAVCVGHGGTYNSQPATNSATGCSPGTYQDQADGATLWNWQCQGSSAPYDVNCTAAKPCTANGASPGAANGSGPGNWVCCNADTDGNGLCGTQSCVADGQCNPAYPGAADGQPPHPQCGCQNADTDGNGLCGAQPICTTWLFTSSGASRGGGCCGTTSNTFGAVTHEYINNTQGCGAYATLGISHYSCGWRGNMRLMLPSAVNNKYVTVKLNYTAQYGGYPPTYRELSFWKNTGNVTGGLRSGITGVLEGPKTDLDGPFILMSDRMYLPLHDNTPHLTRAELKVCDPFGACTADGQVAGPGGCCNGDANNDGICGCVPAADGNPPAVPCGCQNPDVDGNGLCGDQGGGGGGCGCGMYDSPLGAGCVIWEGPQVSTPNPNSYEYDGRTFCYSGDYGNGDGYIGCNCSTSVEGWRCTNLGGCSSLYGVYGNSQCYDYPGTPMGSDWVLDAGCL